MQNARRITLGLGALAVAAWLASSDRTKAPTSTVPQVSDLRAPVAHALGPSIRVASTPERSRPSVSEVATYTSRQRLVRLNDPQTLPEVAASLGLLIERPVGRSGYALLSGAAEDLDRLAEDPRVISVSPVGVTSGASGPSLQLQWHLDMVAPATVHDAQDHVVAVLDSGVAYETATRRGKAYRSAPSLASSPITAPYDFVNDDPWANDDCGHGTHIASVIAGSGTMQGVTPGVGLMPVKVLDHDNRGNEYGLIEGLYHAVDHGADLVNLSLSFRPGYVPSEGLLEALQYAADHGVVMVGAAGNHGVWEVTWPAASPHVIAVGGSQLYPDASLGWHADYMTRIMDYSNKSGAIDIVAPGGNLAVDRNGDGVPDGVLAESVNPVNPADVGYWLMGGTSQAAAITSGMAVQLLSAGVPPQDISPALQSDGLYPSFYSGKGAGYLYAHGETPTSWPTYREFHVAMLPFVEDYYGEHYPAAHITVFDEHGNPVESGLQVVVDVVGDGADTSSCTTDSHGSCMLWTYYGVPPDAVAAWKLTVVGIEDQNAILHRPRAAVTASPALQSFVDVVEQNASLRDAMLAFSWEAGDDVDLGPIGPGLSLADVGGSGLASLPLGVVLTKPAVDRLGSVTSRTLQVDGHSVDVTVLDLGGSGLASLPLGLSQFKILAIDGSGLASLPLGLKAGDLLGKGPVFVPMSGHGLASLPLGLIDSPLGRRLGQGGWTVQGYGAASAIGTSTELPIHLEYTPVNFGATLGSVRYVP